ncbi:MAG: ABC transporter permease [Acidimicrobiales bacterium]|jgi:simple sugar transport system permease protein
MTVTSEVVTPQVVTPEIVTLENLRRITRTRSLGYGVTLVLIGVLEVIWFGGARSALQTTIELGYNSSTVMPSMAAPVRVIVLLIGLLALTPVVARRTRQFLPKRVNFTKGVRNLLIIVGGYLVLWPVVLWLGVNSNGALRAMTIPVSTTGYVVGILSIVAGALLAWRRFDRSASAMLYGGLMVFMLGFLVWVARGSNVSGLHLQLTGILAAAVAAATFLIFGSLSGTLCERSGVVNIAIEGQFMTGAISSVMVVSAMNGSGISLVLGVVVAGLLGALLGWVLAVMSLRYQANQIIVGIVIVAFCTAVTQFIMFQVLDTHENLNGAYALPVWSIPFFSRIPIVGPVLFDQNVLVYVAILGVIVANIALFRTRWGLRVRSVGEKPLASETVGVSVTRMRYGAVVLGGFVAGLGGAAFTIGPGTNFTFGMTNGYGYIALAIMIFGRWRPYGALMASLLFGFTIALSANLNIYLSQLVIPQQFISMLPYIITIAAVAGLVGRIRPPAADGLPFSRE